MSRSTSSLTIRSRALTNASSAAMGRFLAARAALGAHRAPRPQLARVKRRGRLPIADLQLDRLAPAKMVDHRTKSDRDRPLVFREHWCPVATAKRDRPQLYAVLHEGKGQ